MPCSQAAVHHWQCWTDLLGTKWICNAWAPLLHFLMHTLTHTSAMLYTQLLMHQPAAGSKWICNAWACERAVPTSVTHLTPPDNQQ